MIEFLMARIRMWKKLWRRLRFGHGDGPWIESLCLRVCTTNGCGAQRIVYCGWFKNCWVRFSIGGTVSSNCCLLLLFLCLAAKAFH